MKNYSFFIMAHFCFCLSFAQQTDSISKKNNPILFTEGVLGFSAANIDGLVLGYNLKYQTGNNLITFRNIYIASKNKGRDEGLSRAFLFPAYVQGNSMSEYGLLYGKRFIYDNSSLSISLGVSTNKNVYRDKIEGVRVRTESNYIGVPYEINFKWFNRKKARYKILYNLIPIGEPTSLSKSIGFKLYGGFGERSYIGLGLTYGLGWHKKY